MKQALVIFTLVCAVPQILYCQDDKKLKELEERIGAVEKRVDSLDLEASVAPNFCARHDRITVTLPKGKGATIRASRVRDEVAYFWVQYKRGEDSEWLYDGPPFTSIDPRTPITYSERTPGALAPVDDGQLSVRIIARWAIRPNWDKCFPKVKEVPAKALTSLLFFTGTNEGFNTSFQVRWD